MNASTASNVVIVGGGPAGLTAALYLGRFHRAPLVIDSGGSRARWIPASHNIPGFTEGINGPQLLGQMRAQAARHGVMFQHGTVQAIAQHENGFSLTIGQESLLSRFVILASGVKDHFPDLKGVKEATLRSVLRFCPICDGFEASGKRIAVIGNGELGEHEARFLFQTYSKDVSYLDIGNADSARQADLEGFGVRVRKVMLDELRINDDGLALHPRVGATEKYDICYAALGCTPQTHLATSLGASRDETGALSVTKHQQTSINGLYAAGDVVRGLNQIVVAAAEAAIAATDIHNRLLASS
jgi:thioredoxin reductase (NADPH)